LFGFVEIPHDSSYELSAPKAKWNKYKENNHDAYEINLAIFDGIINVKRYCSTHQTVGEIHYKSG
jgi:hypothetical protein